MMDCLPSKTPNLNPYSPEAGVWDFDNMKNECIRYNCPEITTSGIQGTGEYQNGYGSKEPGESKGSYNGFALWPRTNKTNDFGNPLITANSCIAGFKPKGSTLNGTTFTGGLLPQRICNQIGQWGEIVVPGCERLSCEAINPPMPNSENDTSALDAWGDSGGATFPGVLASRSRPIDGPTRPESISIGKCNEQLGYFQATGGIPPTLDCTYLGLWDTVTNQYGIVVKRIKNPCVWGCQAINDAQGRDSNNGFAVWPESKVNTTSGNYSTTVQGSCVSGYVPNPYYGSPVRECESKPILNGRKDVWKAVEHNKACINFCPGFDYDPINGGTSHYSATRGQILVQWPSTPLGTTAYMQSDNCTILDASFFGEGRPTGSGCWRLKRNCKANGQWENPVPLCMANGGKLGFATYPGNPALEAGNSSQKVTGACIDGYRPLGGIPPVRTCVTHTNIDMVFLGLTDGTSECEEVLCELKQNITKSTDSGSIFKGNDEKIKPGEIRNLSCNNNYGYVVIGGERDSTTTQNTCGKSKTDRDPNGPPYVKCLANGTLSFNRLCSKCRDCDSGSTGSSYQVYRSRCDNCVAHTETIDGILHGSAGCNRDAKNGEYKNLAFYYEKQCSNCSCSGMQGTCGVVYAQCSDGQYIYGPNSKDLGHDDGCKDSDNVCLEIHN
jgi:hypothetical protein